MHELIDLAACDSALRAFLSRLLICRVSGPRRADAARFRLVRSYKEGADIAATLDRYLHDAMHLTPTQQATSISFARDVPVDEACAGAVLGALAQAWSFSSAASDCQTLLKLRTLLIENDDMVLYGKALSRFANWDSWFKNLVECRDMVAQQIGMDRLFKLRRYVSEYAPKAGEVDEQSIAAAIERRRRTLCLFELTLSKSQVCVFLRSELLDALARNVVDKDESEEVRQLSFQSISTQTGVRPTHKPSYSGMPTELDENWVLSLQSRKWAGFLGGK